MNKRLLKWILIGAFSTLLMGAAVSCKDYSSDIENLQSQITALSGNVDYLQSLINQGKVVTSVEQTADGTGVTITFSDGSTYTIYNGKDGADGTNGTDGLTPYIGTNGNWWIGDTDTEVAAKGDTGLSVYIDTDGYWRYSDGTYVLQDGEKVEAQGPGGEADTWTIQGGYWYKNNELYKGENGEYSEGVKAQATDGDSAWPNETTGTWWVGSTDTYISYKGEDGKDGDTIEITSDEDGNTVITVTHADDSKESATIKNGDTGKSYIAIPDYDAGVFNIYEITFDESEISTAADGDANYTISEEPVATFPIPSSGDSDSGANLTVVLDGNWLYIYNYYTVDEGGNYNLVENPYKIYLGSELSSVAFVPNYIDEDTHYPTNDPIKCITSYITDDTETDAAGKYYYVTDEEAEEDETLTAGEFKTQTGISVGTTDFDLVYRLNPSDAYIDNSSTSYEFITRLVQTRSGSDVDGDLTDLVTVNSATHEDNSEIVTINASISSDFDESKINLAALRVWIGTDQVITSDYIRVKPGGDGISGVLVNTAETEAGQAGVEYHTRTKSLAYDETYVSDGYESSDFIKEFTGLQTTEEVENTETGETSTVYAVDEDQVNFTLTYNSNDVDSGIAMKINLNQFVGLYTTEAPYAYLVDYFGEDAITLKFTVPTEYDLATGLSASEDDADNIEWTNQQDAITIDEDGYVVYDGSSVGKYPVVRVDAYCTDGDTDFLLASTYIQFKIVGTELDDVEIDLNEFSNNGEYYYIHYRSIETAEGESIDWSDPKDVFASIAYTDILAEAAKDSGLDLTNASNFFNYYETSPLADFYVRTGESTWTDLHYESGSWNEEENLEEKIATASDMLDKLEHSLDVTREHAGFVLTISPGAAVAGKDFVYISVNSGVYTQHTYADTWSEDGTETGAEYYLVLTIQSQNKYVAPDIKIEVRVYVVDDCPEFALNPNYKVKDPSTLVSTLKSTDNAVLVKGTLDDGSFSNVTDVKYHLSVEMNDIFDTDNYPTEDNVSGVAFKWDSEEEGVSPEAEADGYPDIDADYIDSNESGSYVGLTAAIEGRYVAKHMTFNQILLNGEYCPWDYWIIFANPFYAESEAGEVELEDLSEGDSASVNEPVEVYEVDSNGNVTENKILYWGDTSEDGDGSSYGWCFGENASSYGLDAETFDDQVKITYAVDTENGDWTYLQNTLPEGTLTFYVDEIPTDDDDEELTGYAEASDETYPAGTIVWDGSLSGTTLTYQFKICVDVTVEFVGIGTVTTTTTVILNEGAMNGEFTTSALRYSSAVL